MPNIVILDAHTTNPGDLNWDALASLGDLTVYERTSQEHLLERLKNVDIVLTNKVPLNYDTIQASPSLKYIGVLATGYNIVDVHSASKKNIIVTNVPGYSSASVAQLAMAHLLRFCNQVSRHANAVSQGAWAKSQDFSFSLSPQMELEGKVMGIVGLGQTGQRVAELAKAFGMRVIAYTRTPKNDPSIEEVSLESLFRASDVISLHCPLTDQTKELVNAERLSWMKPSSFLINTGRGPLVHEVDLAHALNQGQIAGAGLDVLSCEPCEEHHPLTTAKNCFITPHIAWATREARERLIAMATKNVANYLQGRPTNQVKP